MMKRKIPVEEYWVNKDLANTLSESELQEVYSELIEKIQNVAAEKNISEPEAYMEVVNRYIEIRQKNLPEFFVLDNDPLMFEKLMEYSEKGIRNVAVLTEDEYTNIMNTLLCQSLLTTE